MSAALMGLISGFVQADTARIKAEREDEENLMLNRMKLAAANKAKLEEEYEKRKAAARDRYDFVETNFKDATDIQKIAIASNPFLASSLKAKLEAGQSINLDQDLVVDKDKVRWKSAQEYIDSLTQMPAQEPVQIEQKTTGFLDSRVTPTRKRMESMASTFGGATPEELLAYERQKSPEQPEAVGSLREGFFKKPKSFDAQMDEQVSRVYELEQKDPNSPEFEKEKSKLTAMVAWKESLDPKQATWASMVGGLKMKAMAETDPTKRKQLYDQVAEAQRIDELGKKKEGEGEKIPAPGTLASLFAKAAANAITEKYGKDVRNDLIINTNQFGETSFQYVGTDPAMRSKVLTDAKKAIAATASPYLTMDGRPVNGNVRAALSASGITFDGNKPIFTAGEAAPSEAPTAPTAPSKTPKTQQEFDAAWAKLDPGQTIVGLDGKVYTKGKK